MTLVRLLLAVSVMAWTSGATAEERSSLWPDVPLAMGEPHPEGNEFWRKNHMSLMRHDRDLTMQQGDRDIGASLKGCFDCHTTKAASGTVLTYADEGHFCRACHDFAAVKVDCFTCHRSTPEGTDEAMTHAAILPGRAISAGDVTQIRTYLELAAREETEQ